MSENQKARSKNQDSGKSQEPRAKNQDRNEISVVEDIESLIPQQPPFVMVDKLLHSDEKTTESSFLISADNVLVKNNLFQEAGLMENIAQTAALRAGYSARNENRPVTRGYIGSVKNFEVFSLPKVNDELLTEIIIENQVFDVIVFSGKVWHNDELLASCEMKVFGGVKVDTHE